MKPLSSRYRNRANLKWNISYQPDSQSLKALKVKPNPLHLKYQSHLVYNATQVICLKNEIRRLIQESRKITKIIKFTLIFK